MKNAALLAVFILGLAVIGCNNEEKERAEMERIRQDSIRVADSLAQVQQEQENQRMLAERRQIMESGDTFVPDMAGAETMEKQISEGKVIILSEAGETMPLRLEGSKVMAVTMPDGKLYQVRKDGDKTMVVIPGQGEMEKREINGQIYLVDNDDNMYMVKMADNKLIAVLDDGTEINLARK